MTPTDRRIAERRKIVRRRKLALAEAIRVNDARPVGREASRSSSIDRRRPDSDRRKAPQAESLDGFAICKSCGGTFTLAEKHDCPGIRAAAPTPVQPAGAPIRLNSAQSALVELWAKDDRLWTTQETVAFNLEVFARATLAAASVPVQPVTEQEAREFLSEWGVQNRKLNYYTPDKCDLPLEARPSVVDMMTAFANRTAPAREGK